MRGVKELPGGACPDGFHSVPIEYIGDLPTPIAITHFDFDSLDAIEARVLEILDTPGATLEPFLRALAAALSHTARAEGFNLALAHIIGARKPRLKAYQMAFAGGLAVTQGWSGEQIANKFGRRKQAFYQGVQQARHELGIDHLPMPNRRDPEARQKMRLRNYRHPKLSDPTSSTTT